MKKGFTLLELLVASLLLGMLVTILTMIFNQSSIAWRTGVAGVADLDEVRENVASVREEADSVYVWGSDMYRVLSPWDDDTGNLRTRAVSAADSSENATYLKGLNKNTTLKSIPKVVSVGSGSGGKSIKTWIVNVKSAGPNKEFGDWDDIWSYPDDFN